MRFKRKWPNFCYAVLKVFYVYRVTARQHYLFFIIMLYVQIIHICWNNNLINTFFIFQKVDKSSRGPLNSGTGLSNRNCYNFWLKEMGFRPPLIIKSRISFLPIYVNDSLPLLTFLFESTVDGERKTNLAYLTKTSAKICNFFTEININA